MKRWTCKSCDRTFSSRYARDRHTDGVHGEKVVCEYCRKRYSSHPAVMVTHLRDSCKGLKRFRAMEKLVAFARSECARASKYPSN